MKHKILTLLLVLALILAACGDDDDDGAAASSDDSAASDDGGFSGDFDSADAAEQSRTTGDDGSGDDGAMSEDGSFDGEEASLANAGGQAIPGQPIDIGRDLIFTATVAVEVDDVAAASQQAITAISGLGGLVYGQETVSNPVPRTTLTFRVQPGDFQEALSRLGNVGLVVDQVITTDDVTERVTDLESRIVSAEASVERLRTFLEGAASLEDVAEFERELLARETDLELLRGQLRTVQGQVDLATITVTLTQKLPGPSVQVTTLVYPGHDGGAGCGSAEVDLEIDEGELVTLCYEVLNSGDTHLTDVELRHSRLDVDARDVTLLSGDELLAPGARARFFAEITADRSAGDGARVSAQPADAEGDPIDVASVSAGSTVELTVVEDDSLPGFTDSLGRGWNALVATFSVVLVVVGVLLPFVWVPVIAWLVWRWQQSRRPRPIQPNPPTAPAPPTS